jgi:hypothetical protein
MLYPTRLAIYKNIVFAAAVLMVSGSKSQPVTIYHTTSGRIDFRSDAPLEIIRASSNDLLGVLDISKNNFSFKVVIRSFEGFNSPLQKEHFNENYLESDKYAEASFKGKIIEDADLTVDGTYEVRAKGNLTIHNVMQERIIKCAVTVKNKIITIHSSFTVLLSEHNIPIPKVVYQKLANEIKVEVTATLEPR